MIRTGFMAFILISGAGQVCAETTCKPINSLYSKACIMELNQAISDSYGRGFQASCDMVKVALEQAGELFTVAVVPQGKERVCKVTRRMKENPWAYFSAFVAPEECSGKRKDVPCALVGDGGIGNTTTFKTTNEAWKRFQELRDNKDGKWMLVLPDGG